MQPKNFPIQVDLITVGHLGASKSIPFKLDLTTVRHLSLDAASLNLVEALSTNDLFLLPAKIAAADPSKNTNIINPLIIIIISKQA